MGLKCYKVLVVILVTTQFSVIAAQSDENSQPETHDVDYWDDFDDIDLMEDDQPLHDVLNDAFKDDWDSDSGDNFDENFMNGNLEFNEYEKKFEDSETNRNIKSDVLRNGKDYQLLKDTLGYDPDESNADSGQSIDDDGEMKSYSDEVDLMVKETQIENQVVKDKKSYEETGNKNDDNYLFNDQEDINLIMKETYGILNDDASIDDNFDVDDNYERNNGETKNNDDKYMYNSKQDIESILKEKNNILNDDGDENDSNIIEKEININIESAETLQNNINGDDPNTSSIENNEHSSQEQEDIDLIMKNTYDILNDDEKTDDNFDVDDNYERKNEEMENNDDNYKYNFQQDMESILKDTSDILNEDDNEPDFNNNEENIKDNFVSADNLKIELDDEDSNTGFIDNNDVGDQELEDLNKELADLFEAQDSIKGNVNLEFEIKDEESDNNNTSSYEEIFSELNQSKGDDSKSQSLETQVQNERSEVDQLNALLEKSLLDLSNLSNGVTEEDYDDFYDDIQGDSPPVAEIHKTNKQANSEQNAIEDLNNKYKIPYGDDGLDPNATENVDSTEHIENEQNEEFPEQRNLADSDEYSMAKPENENYASQELADLMTRFKEDNKEELDVNSSNFNRDVAAVHMTLSVDDTIVVTSPNYPEPYPPNNIIDWMFDGEDGSGIEFNITDFFVNGAAGDYLLIKPGGIDASGSDGLVFSYSLNQEKLFRFFDVDRMFVRFDSRALNNELFRGFQFSIKFIEPKRLVAEPVPEPEPTIAEPSETVTVYLGGVTPHEFLNVSSGFKSIVTDMAIMHTTQNDIDTGILPLSEVVQLTRVSVCNINWPSYETCAAVTFGIPLIFNSTEEETEYELSATSLRAMWDAHSSNDPFASRLSLLGITHFELPDDRAVLTLWFVLSIGALLSILMLVFAVWKWNCFEDYTAMKRLTETDSNFSQRKSDLSLFPTPHQQLAPVNAPDGFDIYWDGDLPPKYDDTTRVDMGGAFDNRSFVRDGELFDLDSDEEIIMSLPDGPDGRNSARFTTDA